jgi:hypothetical protein
MLDEGLVEAAQTIRALEDEDVEDYYPIEASRSSPSPEPVARPSKRIRVGDAEGEANGRPRVAGAANGGPAGLLDEDAMENLRFYAELARKQAEETKAKKAAPVPAGKAGMASLLGGYGSGDESD